MTDHNGNGVRPRGNMLRWLIPLFLLLAAAWFFMQHKNEAKVSYQSEENKTNQVAPSKEQSTKGATHTHADGTVHEGHHHGDHGHTHNDSGEEIGKVSEIQGNVTGMLVDKAGNLIKDGQLLHKKGEFTLKDGEFFDLEGQSLGNQKKHN